MFKVYTVEKCEFGDSYLDGICSSLEEAKRYAQAQAKDEELVEEAEPGSKRLVLRQTTGRWRGQSWLIEERGVDEHLGVEV